MSIPWSAGPHVTRGTAARLGSVRTIELWDDAARECGARLGLKHALKRFRVLEHLPALPPGGQRSLIIRVRPKAAYCDNQCAHESWF